MNTFAQFDSFLGSKDARNVQGIRSTEIRRITSDRIAVRYHGTTVVLAHRDGTFTLNTSGYRTATTKTRINEYSPAQVFQRDFAWFLVDRSNGQKMTCVDFADGMRVDANGYPMSADYDFAAADASRR